LRTLTSHPLPLPGSSSSTTAKLRSVAAEPIGCCATDSVA
jgi:hypothetical protein